MSPRDPALDRILALPPQEVAAALAALPEGQWLERKSIRVQPPQLAQAQVAFANAEGGTIVVGIHEGRVEGTDGQARHRNALMQAAIDHSEPRVPARSRLVECRNQRGQTDHLLVFDIGASEVVHATSRDEVFLRVGDESRRLTFIQRQELVYDKRQAHFDGTAVADVTPDDLDGDLLHSFAMAVGVGDHGRLLQARGLLTRSGAVTTAAYLLFGRTPQDAFPAAFVRVIRYRGRVRGAGARQELLADYACDGSISEVITAAVERVRALEPKRRVLGGGGRFVLQGLVPEPAWLEGIVNAVVHRSYSLGGDHVRVEIFDDRIEVESPGRFPGLVRIADPRKIVRFARNPRIARVCSDLGFGQELGEGIRRMFEEMRLHGLAQPLYTQTAGSVRLTLSAVLVDPEQAARLPAQYPRILELLRGEAPVSTGDVAEVLGVAQPTAIRYLKAMREVGLIDWVGKSARDPRAYWRLHSE
jgi:ATP-dependent DNA helicase RecG